MLLKAIFDAEGSSPLLAKDYVYARFPYIKVEPFLNRSLAAEVIAEAEYKKWKARQEQSA